MEFRTKVEIPVNKFSIKPSDHIMLLGSCFAEHIGKRLQTHKFQCNVNPFGVLYNPESIRLCLETLLNHLEQQTGFPPHYLFQEGGYWNSWLHTSKFAATSRENCLEHIEQQLHQAADFLMHTDYLFLTFGTNRRYEHKEYGFTVGNCHKQPAAIFQTVDDSPEAIAASYLPLLERLHRLIPHLRIVFTVSPYRYAKYGFHGNQLSKASLLLAVDKLVNNEMPSPLKKTGCSFQRTGHLVYFPAYELLLDELRDYRFYATDMLHPSEQAIDYIWERFGDAYFSPETLHFLKEWHAIENALNHRPFHPEAPEYRNFIHKIVLKIEQLREIYPNLAVENELNELKKRID